MIIGIHQPNYLPWLGYFFKMLKSDVFIILDDAQYSKNSYINRSRIKSPTGPQWLTVPVISKGRLGQPINEAEIESQTAWWAKHRKTIESTYARSSNLGCYWPSLQEIYSASWPTMARLNIFCIQKIALLLGIGTRIVIASELQSQKTGTDRLIELCQAVGASVYLSGSGGRKYQDESAFHAAGIDLRYMEFNHPRYPQLWGDFVEGLSIIDLLLNCGERSREILASSCSGAAGV